VRAVREQSLHRGQIAVPDRGLERRVLVGILAGRVERIGPARGAGARGQPDRDV
jgi:hypothetical protein